MYQPKLLWKRLTSMYLTEDGDAHALPHYVVCHIGRLILSPHPIMARLLEGPMVTTFLRQQVFYKHFDICRSDFFEASFRYTSTKTSLHCIWILPTAPHISESPLKSDMNPYEARPDKIPPTDSYINEPAFGRYQSQPKDFRPNEKYCASTSSDALEYWADVLQLCNEDTIIFDNP